MYNKYLSSENVSSSKIDKIIEKYLSDTITTDSSGVSQEQPFDNSFRKKKKKIFKRELDEKVYIDAIDIIDALGGKKYFEKNFKTVKDAEKYIEKNMLDVIKIFRATQNDIPWNDINVELNKIIKN